MEEELKRTIDERVEVLTKIKCGLIERLNLYQTVAQIDDDTPLFGMGFRLDSIDATEVIALLDAEFSITVKLEERADQSFMRTINTIADFVLEQGRQRTLSDAANMKDGGQ